MVVHPLRHVGYLPDPDGGSDVVAAVERVMSAVRRLGPQATEAAGAILERVAWHRRQRIGSRLDLTEMCPSYIATKGIPLSTARRAWDAIRGALGWFELDYHRAVDVGAQPRGLPAGKRRHGRFLALDAATTEAARRAASALGATGPASGLGPPIPIADGRRVLCPWHDDHRPSLVLAPDGSARCWACGGAGRWERGRAGTTIRRRQDRPTEDRPSTRFPHRGHTGGVAPVPDLGPRQEPYAGRTVFTHRSVSSRGARTRVSDHGDLLDVLVSTDRHHRSRVHLLPAGEEHRHAAIPDRYVSLDRQRVVAWEAVERGGRSFRVPSATESVGTRWLMLDLDDATDWPSDPTGDPRWWGRDLGPRVEAAVVGALGSAASGRVVVQRTSIRGLHVLVELAEEHPSPAWAAPLPAWWRALADAVVPVVAEAFPGVVADPRAVGRNRSVRKPGLRRLKERHGGIPFVVRVAYATGWADTAPAR